MNNILKKSIKIIISTGQGRLHVFESAASLKKLGMKVKVITGWVPSVRTPDYLLNFLGKIIGRTNLAYGLRKRTSTLINRNEINNCTYSEFFIQFLFFLSKFRIIKRETAATIGWKAYGIESKKFIKDCHIFHVRSGAGKGGAINHAKKLNIKVVVDHSIAHPKELYNQVLKANNGKKYDFLDPNNLFWKMVVDDCHQADMIQVNSQYVKDSFIENGFLASSISVIHLGISDIFYNLKKTYSINGSVKLLFTGGFGLRKGGDIIIKAVSMLIAQNIKFRLDIVGSILNDLEIPEWFLKNSNIHLHGHLPQNRLMRFLSESDLYIFPSYSEGSAQSVKEAMAAGMPVITTKESGSPIISGENGLLINSNSPSDLFEAIINLKNNEKHRAYIGDNACNTIKLDHTWEKYAQNTKKMYDKLLEFNL
tara:strand:- start:698 stop:1966 length:1269 start_codon:yes stop_codon:yes gene_type:complete